MYNSENYEQISLIIDAEFAKIFSSGRPLWLISKKQIAVRAENLRSFINEYIDLKEKMQIELIEDQSSKKQELSKQTKEPR